MSLVGTRPPTLDEWEKYEPHHRARMSFRPGLTGLWQVSGRSNITDFEEVVKLDMEAYELNTGKVIIETIEKMNYDPMAIPGIVVKNHGPFAWGSSPANAVYNAVVMENVAEMDIKTLLLNSQAEMKQYVLDKHYMRKHGPNAYYGQK